MDLSRTEPDVKNMLCCAMVEASGGASGRTSVGGWGPGGFGLRLRQPGLLSVRQRGEMSQRSVLPLGFNWSWWVVGQVAFHCSLLCLISQPCERLYSGDSNLVAKQSSKMESSYISIFIRMGFFFFLTGWRQVLQLENTDSVSWVLLIFCLYPICGRSKKCLILNLWIKIQVSKQRASCNCAVSGRLWLFKELILPTRQIWKLKHGIPFDF